MPFQYSPLIFLELDQKPFYCGINIIHLFTQIIKIHYFTWKDLNEFIYYMNEASEKSENAAFYG